MSRIGKKPVAAPKGVNIEIKETFINVKGPKGQLQLRFPKRFKVESKDENILISRPTDSKLDKSMHGTIRSIISNMIKGVTEGFSKELEIRGLGFRAQLQGKTLNLQLGFTHPVNFNIPEGIQIELPKPTQIIIKGPDKQLVGEVAAKIRSFRKPEPYKGTGIRYRDEFVRRKAGKAVA